MSIEAKELPPLEYLRECFDLDADTGALLWRVRPDNHFATKRAWAVSNSRQAGKVAGADNGKGYLRAKISGTHYLCHRVAYYLHNSLPPPRDRQIDHINGNPSDNRPANLRLATPPQNQHNRPTTVGCSFNKATQKWRARIQFNGKAIYLGLFPDIMEARIAYLKARDFYFGEFSPAL